MGIPTSLPYGYDTHLEYDHASERWFAVALAAPGSADSSVLVEVIGLGKLVHWES